MSLILISLYTYNCIQYTEYNILYFKYILTREVGSSVFSHNVICIFCVLTLYVLLACATSLCHIPCVTAV